MKNRSKITHFRHSLSFVFLLVLFICFWVTVAYAEVFTVINLDDSGAGSLRVAIEAANDNDEVDEITFNVTGMITLSSQLQISSGMTIEGPGADLLDISGNNACRVFYINTSESVDISGISIMSGDIDGDGAGIWTVQTPLTLTDCVFSGNIAEGTSLRLGGGICNDRSSLSITKCSFVENSADFGGGMNNYLSSPDITNCTFSQNHARSGGAICNTTANPTFTNCIFSNNTASAFGSGIYNSGSAPVVISCDFSLNNANYGGGMYNSGSSPDITKCTFIENYATFNGGGISNRNNSDLVISDSTFSGNNAGDDGGGIDNSLSCVRVITCALIGNNANKGGGIYDYNSSSSVITNCTFADNSADSAGGGIYVYNSNSSMTSCTFSSNSADSSGGGMYNNVSSPDISNCTFDGNSAISGAGMYNYRSEYTYVNNCTFCENQASSAGGLYNSESPGVMVIDCTFSGNIATINGSAIFNFDSSPTIINSIFWDDQGGEIFNASVSSQPYVVFCVVRNDETGDYSTTENIITADPMLEPLADNGGPTWTCALGAGSSAIDEGAYEEGMPTVDQRGVSRPQGAGYDIGAFEVVQSSKVGVGGDGGGGCDISAMPTIGFLLLIPFALLLKLRK